MFYSAFCFRIVRFDIVANGLTIDSPYHQNGPNNGTIFEKFVVTRVHDDIAYCKRRSYNKMFSSLTEVRLVCTCCLIV